MGTSKGCPDCGSATFDPKTGVLGHSLDCPVLKRLTELPRGYSPTYECGSCKARVVHTEISNSSVHGQRVCRDCEEAMLDDIADGLAQQRRPAVTFRGPGPSRGPHPRLITMDEIAKSAAAEKAADVMLSLRESVGTEVHKALEKLEKEHGQSS